MARTVLTLALLACLGFAVLQLVSGEQQQKELEATSNEAVQAKAEDVQFRVVRDADAKKRSQKKKGSKKARKGGKGKGKNTRKGNKKGRKPARKGGKGKGKNTRKGKKKGGKPARKGVKGKGKNTRKGIKKEGKGNGKKASKGKGSKQARLTCTSIDYKDAAKKYRRYSNNLRQAKRLTKVCNRMVSKESKASEFNTSAIAPGNSKLAAQLKNCSKTVKANCAVGKLPECNQTFDACKTSLESWINGYSLDTGSCLNGAADLCTCIKGLPTDPKAECLDFKTKETKLKPFKTKCISGTEGSGGFGACRKLQIKAADDCGNTDVTTAGSSGRRRMIRKNLMKKWIKN